MACLDIPHQTEIVLHRREFLGIAPLTAAVGLTHRQQLADAELPGRAQYAQTVIDEQGPLGLEVHFRAQGLPEALLLLGITEVVGADQALEPRSEEHTSELQSRPHLVCRL